MSSPVVSPFRADLEGLRALAVLLVVACHARVPGLQGGFIGVDVFFVISGYLITRLLLAEWQQQGRLDIAAFYARRVRRLLPAFTLMLLFVVAATWYIYAPPEQPYFLASAFAAALYFSNVHYALESTDYMAPSAKQDPLLHTWSLGVEEQFYLVWPLLLIATFLLARRSGRQTLPLALLLTSIGLASLVACVALTQTRQPLAFFLPATRAWEFCLGAAVVLLESRLTLRGVVTTAGALAGLLIVPLSALLLSPRSAFPGTAAIAPAVGTALLILLVPRLAPGSPIARLLAAAPLQWLGRLSYGWYLWHWPLLVIGRVVVPEQGLAGDLALAGLALLLAQASYVLIEHPVRRSPRFGRKAVALVAAVLVTTTSLFLINRVGSNAIDLAGSKRFERFTAVLTDSPAIYAYKCDGWFYSARLIECESGALKGEKTAVLLGDSHAGQWFSAFNEVMYRAGWRMVLMTKSACPIVDQDYFYDRIGRVFTECAEWRKAALEKIRATRPQLVIITSAEDYPFSAGEWAAGTARVVDYLAPSTANIVLLRDTPAPGFSAPECLARREWNPALSPATCAFDHIRWRSPQVLQALESAASRHPNVHLVDMTPFVCDQNPCEVNTADTIKYRDRRHLSDSFVRMLSPQLRNTLLAAGAFGGTPQ